MTTDHSNKFFPDNRVLLMRHIEDFELEDSELEQSSVDQFLARLPMLLSFISERDVSIHFTTKGRTKLTAGELVTALQASHVNIGDVTEHEWLGVKSEVSWAEIREIVTGDNVHIFVTHEDCLCKLLQIRTRADYGVMVGKDFISGSI